MSRESFSNIKMSSVYKILFVLVTLTALLYRISIHADIYDEIINLSISYRIALGDVPFYNCWEAFQSGDIFMAPFLWLYISIFNRTSGMILYSRIVYIGALLFVAILMYWLMRRHMSKESAFFLSYIILFFNLYSLFYIWYDTASVIFLTLGVIFLVKSFDVKSRVKRNVLLIGAGIMHCCMAFSYPSFILLALIMAAEFFVLRFIVHKKNITESLLDVIFYAVGAILVILALLIYIFSNVSVADFFETLGIIMASRGGTGNDFLSILQAIVVAYVSVNKYLIPVTIFLGIIYFKVLKEKKYVKLLLLGIIVLPIFNQFFIGENTLMGLANYLSYLMIWCPFLYYLLDKKQMFDKNLFYMFYVPSIVSSFLISLTTVYADIGPVKSWQACLPGALASLYFIVKIGNEMKWGNINKILYVVIIVLLINSYSYIYLNQPYITSENTRMKDGLYWGIKVNESMECMVQIQNLVLTNIDECDTILAGGSLRSIYLMTELRPCVWTVEAPAYFRDGEYRWDYAIEYFEYFDEYPDVMFLQPYEVENEEILKLLEEKYVYITQEKIGQFDIIVYKNKDVIY